jgi:hypothetical protein
MTIDRRCFLAQGALLATGALLPLTAAAQWGVVHEISGRVLLNGRPMVRHHAIQPGHTIATGPDGRVWFSVAGDAFFLRPGSELRLRPAGALDTAVEALRLVSGALGATFRRGVRRTVHTPTVTIGIRGTGIYLEATPQETYACTCFGAVELTPAAAGSSGQTVAAQNHAARRVSREGVSAAGMERHTSEEISRLERLVGRPNPF